MSDFDLPDGHPLEPYSDKLDTHEGRLEAYVGVLDDADPDEIHGVMLVMYGEDGTDTFPSVSPDIDPRLASLWMLGAHIHHVTSSAQGARGTLTMEQAAEDAIEYIRRNGLTDPDA